MDKAPLLAGAAPVNSAAEEEEEMKKEDVDVEANQAQGSGVANSPASSRLVGLQLSFAAHRPSSKDFAVDEREEDALERKYKPKRVFTMSPENAARKFRGKAAMWTRFLNSVCRALDFKAWARTLTRTQPPFWSDPANFASNIQPKHVPLRLYTSVEEAFNCGLLEGAPPRRSSARSILLDSDGDRVVWRFHLFDNPASVPISNLALPDFDDSSWGESVRGPSQWQLVSPTWGDVPMYFNFKYPIPGRFSNLSTSVSSSDNPTGVYRISFALPETWARDVASGLDDVFLIIHGAGSCYEAYLNGAKLGHSTDSMTESEFLVTGAIGVVPASPTASTRCTRPARGARVPPCSSNCAWPRRWAPATMSGKGSAPTSCTG